MVAKSNHFKSFNNEYICLVKMLVGIVTLCLLGLTEIQQRFPCTFTVHIVSHYHLKNATSLWAVEKISATGVKTVQNITYLWKCSGFADDEIEAVTIAMHIRS